MIAKTNVNGGDKMHDAYSPDFARKGRYAARKGKSGMQEKPLKEHGTAHDSKKQEREK